MSDIAVNVEVLQELKRRHHEESPPDVMETPQDIAKILRWHNEQTALNLAITAFTEIQAKEAGCEACDENKVIEGFEETAAQLHRSWGDKYCYNCGRRLTEDING